MNYFIFCLFAVTACLTGCSGKKEDQTQTTAVKISLPDSIDHAIYVYDQRLDIKMKRKVYEPTPGTLVTIQKWYEFGDTARLVKMRAETLTGDTKMEITVYHYIENKLAKLHEYQYDKRCAGKQRNV
ncbi:hypothetical protein GO730_17810 [Spirosoma sp. HMF3257]|uniref:Uncharacterized protein n=1 Tax=Spirosoma telluris TaxID=2183553 RepID=A0A327NME2_9BACT|nr:hypothetical protein [Spirosoma telluris]RAI75549.1 hypothetical protein HMF3257_17730 [Spirosoma telluris]